jgi:glycosyltransferase involved in cell wall biosynthesis
MSEMSSEPLVTIVTPSFNQGRFLEATICSVLEQDYPHIEYLVMDGASTDESLSILHKYADRLTYWESQPDHGQAHAVNKGLSRARGQLLGWLNSDDLLASGAVSRAVQVFQSQPEIDVLYGCLARIDEHGRSVPTPILPKDRLEFGLPYLIGECIVNQPGAFWRRRIMNQVGLLDESLMYSLDYEYWIRMALAGAKFKRIDPIVAYFRLSPGSKTVGQTAAQAEEQLGTLEKVLSDPHLGQKLGLPASQIARQSRQARASIALRAAYGRAKTSDYLAALHWLAVVLRNDPRVLIQPRYIALGIASLRRRLRAWPRSSA